MEINMDMNMGMSMDMNMDMKHEHEPGCEHGCEHGREHGHCRNMNMNIGMNMDVRLRMRMMMTLVLMMLILILMLMLLMQKQCTVKPLFKNLLQKELRGWVAGFNPFCPPIEIRTLEYPGDLATGSYSPLTCPSITNMFKYSVCFQQHEREHPTQCIFWKT